MRVALAASLALLAFVGAMMLFQDQLLFPTSAVPAAGKLPAGAEVLQIGTDDGQTLGGVYIKPNDEVTGARTLVVGFGGNAWNGQHVAEYLSELFPEAHVIAFHYRGYRPSTGRPSAAALLEDAPQVLRAAARKVRPDRTVAIGFSIGSGIAASLARQPGIDGLILVTPFDSLKAAAADLYPWLPVGLFIQHEVDSGDYLANSNVPVAIISAERDEIIAPRRTDALRARVSNLRFNRTISGAGHNDLYGRSDFQEAMREALEAIAAK